MRLLVVYCEVPLGLGRCEAQATRGCTQYLRWTGGRRLRSGDCGGWVGGRGRGRGHKSQYPVGVRRPGFLLVHVTTGK